MVDPTARLEENSELSPAYIMRAAAERLRVGSQAMQVGIDRAKEYAQNDQRKGYFVGLSNLRLENPSPEAGTETCEQATTEALVDLGLSISVVDNPPNLVHLAHALIPKLQGQYALLGHLAKRVEHEMFISDDLASNWQAALNIAHRVIYALRIKTGNLCQAVGASRVSWNQMAVESASLEIVLLDSLGMPRWEDSDTSVSLMHLSGASRLLRGFSTFMSRLHFDLHLIVRVKLHLLTTLVRQ